MKQYNPSFEQDLDRDFDLRVDLTDKLLSEQEEYIERAFKGSTKLRDAVYTCRQAILGTFSDEGDNIYVENPFSFFEIPEEVLDLDFKLDETDGFEDSLRIRDYVYKTALYSLLFNNYLDNELSFEDFEKMLPDEMKILVNTNFPSLLNSTLIIKVQTHLNQLSTSYGIIDVPIRTWVSRRLQRS
jgi:hypothetical protein